MDLIENYNGMNRLRAAYAEGYIDELFTLDEAQALKDYLDRTVGHKGTTTIKKRKLPITNNVVGWKSLAKIAMSGSWMKFQAIRCHSKLRVALNRGDSLAD